MTSDFLTDYIPTQELEDLINDKYLESLNPVIPYHNLDLKGGNV